MIVSREEWASIVRFAFEAGLLTGEKQRDLKVVNRLWWHFSTVSA